MSYYGVPLLAILSKSICNMASLKHPLIATTGHGDMHDLTTRVAEVIRAAGIETGLVNVHVVGSTGAIGTIEYEPGLQRDLPDIFDQLMPPGRHYGHEQAWHDGNAHSHLQATTLGPSITVPV